MWFIVWIYSFFTIPKENSPAMDIPMFVVNTVNPGADPKSIENQITNKLEDEFKSISWIKRLESVSNPNFSTIIVTFNDSKNINDAKLELDSAVNKASLPQNIKKPVFSYKDRFCHFSAFLLVGYAITILFEGPAGLS